MSAYCSSGDHHPAKGILDDDGAVEEEKEKSEDERERGETTNENTATRNNDGIEHGDEEESAPFQSIGPKRRRMNLEDSPSWEISPIIHRPPITSTSSFDDSLERSFLEEPVADDSNVIDEPVEEKEIIDDTDEVQEEMSSDQASPEADATEASTGDTEKDKEEREEEDGASDKEEKSKQASLLAPLTPPSPASPISEHERAFVAEPADRKIAKAKRRLPAARNDPNELLGARVPPSSDRHSFSEEEDDVPPAKKARLSTSDHPNGLIDEGVPATIASSDAASSTPLDDPSYADIHMVTVDGETDQSKSDAASSPPVDMTFNDVHMQTILEGDHSK
uniref:Uncharacterized protein n=1 Tax=Pristionchus pacificus TaxID=54126 RepID=A0A2A6BUC4_PRIPA